MFSFNIGTAVAAAINLFSKGLDFLLPLWYIVLSFLKWIAKNFWLGLIVIATNLITLFAIVPLMIGSGYYGYKTCEPKVVKKLHKEYKFVPRSKSSSINVKTKNFFEGMNPWKN